MTDDLVRLLNLQGIDDSLRSLEQEQAGLPAARDRMEARRAASERALADGEEALRDADRRRRELEARLQDQEVLLRRLEGQQHQVRSNEAYTALLHEMDAAREAISECETGVLLCLEEIEGREARLARAREAHAALQAELAEASRSLDEREAALREEIAHLREARAKEAAGIPAPLLRHYERIAGHRWPPLARVSGEVCSACRIGIPPQQVLVLLQGGELVTCGACHRILVHERLGEGS